MRLPVGTQLGLGDWVECVCSKERSAHKPDPTNPTIDAAHHQSSEIVVDAM
jgi:hypothetical protein